MRSQLDTSIGSRQIKHVKATRATVTCAYCLKKVPKITVAQSYSKDGRTLYMCMDCVISRW